VRGLRKYLGRPPLVITMVYAGLLFVALPVLLSTTYPQSSWGPVRGVPWNVTGIVPLLMGFGLAAAAEREHLTKLRGRTSSPTIEYFLQAGPYHYTRNPMYLAGVLIWIGWIMLFGSLYLLFGMLLLFVGISIAIIPYEENQMETRFGDAYLRYKKEVPRWLGRRKSTPGAPRIPDSHKDG
jgi:protein-S-isoprenylcysteine O-methyltransferase Ste14